MINWSSDKGTFNQFENAKIIGYEFICRSQAAGTNDKKWNFGKCNMLRCEGMTCRQCSSKSSGNIYISAANTKPEFTPEQQEMLDYFENAIKSYDFAYSIYKDLSDYSLKETYSTIKTRIIEIINKHRSK